MPVQRRPSPVVFLLLTGLLAIGLRAQAAIVVEELNEEGPAVAAGIRAGDVLLSWSRPASPPLHPEAAAGAFRTPLDLLDVVVEQQPRGSVVVAGERAGEPMTWTLPEAGPDWGLTRTIVLLEPADEERRRASRSGLTGSDESATGEETRALARELAERGKPTVAAWILADAARVLDESGNLVLADELLVAAQESLDGASHPLDLALLHESMAGRMMRRDLDRAVQEQERALALRERARPDSLLVARTVLLLGNLQWYRQDVEAAETLYRRASTIGEALAPRSSATAVTLSNLGMIARMRGDLPTAESFLQRSLEIHEQNDARSHDAATALNLVGSVAYQRGALDAAEQTWTRALSIFQEIDPGGFGVSMVQNGLANVASSRGDFEAGEELLLQSLAITEKLAPDSLEVATALYNLGNVASRVGDTTRAEDYHRRALDIRKRLTPGGLGVAMSLGSLALDARQRGDLAEAEGLLRRAIAIEEKLAPDSLDVAWSLDVLGEVLERRKDHEGAELFHRRALAIRERLAPGSLDLSATLLNLGNVAISRGELDAASDFHDRALAIREQLAPDSDWVASSLNNLGNVALRRDDLAAAEAHYRRAMELGRKKSPGSLQLMESLQNLARVTGARGDTASAEKLVREALLIVERLAPGSLQEARAHAQLADIRRLQGRLQEAVDLLWEALDTLELQVGRLGGTQEQRTAFAEGQADWHRRLIELLVRLDRPREAFETLEASRGRQMVSLLNERELVFSTEIPPELERERMLANAAYERTQQKISALHPVDDHAEIDSLLAELHGLRRERDDIRARIRRKSPRLAELRQPEALDLTGVQASLDPGTLALAYSVGREKTHLFAVTQRGLSAHELPMKREALAGRIGDLRSGIMSSANTTRGGDALRTLSESLSDDLLLPVADQIAEADRLLLLPDGPLHYLPFAVLATPGTEIAERRPYLIESLPLHSVVSMGVYAQVRQDAGRARPMRVAALGDPDYSTATETPRLASLLHGVASATTRSAATLTRLPATRTEVEALDALFGEGASTWLNAAATEERARQLGPEYTVVHFATHGLINEQFPLDSALAFSMPPADDVERENGLLQAWEIFESVRLDADLVTLSACQTALGKETGGEGIVGLTRAFHYAGASSVLSSLWSVSDASTAVLMKRFYGHLSKGAPKDEALRAAQLELLRGPLRLEDDDPTRGIKGVSRPSGGKKGHQSRQDPAVREMDATHPFYWAAFVLSGDWN